MRIFVNNVDGYLAGAICADLTKISKNLVGTRKLIRDELVPPMVKRIVPRVDVRRFLKAVTSCNVIVYDMHDADFEELELVVRMLQALGKWEMRELIAANAANPKSQGPFTMSGQLVSKVLEEALAEKSGTHRGWVISGFPKTLEEALAFYSAAPPTPADPPKKGAKEAEAVNLDDVKFKDDWKPDVMVFVNSAREVCQARSESSGDMIEKEFQTGMDQWLKDSEQIQEILTKHLGAVEVKVSSDQAAEAEREKHQAEVKAAEEEEREPPVAPDEKDLVVVASSSSSWLEPCIALVGHALQELHPVFNFLPPNDALASQQASKAESGEGGYEAPKEQNDAQKDEEKLRQEAKVEQVRKEELARLEKHSEPLRLYLMKFVVPALTGAMVELCHEQPEDPVGYLAEYLSLYSEVSRERETSTGS